MCFSGGQISSANKVARRSFGDFQYEEQCRQTATDRKGYRIVSSGHTIQWVL